MHILVYLDAHILDTIRPTTHHISRETIFAQVSNSYSHVRFRCITLPSIACLLNILKDQDNNCAYKIPENKDENTVFIIFLKECISSDSFEALDIKNSNSDADAVNNSYDNPTAEFGKIKFHNVCIFLMQSYMNYIH